MDPVKNKRVLRECCEAVGIAVSAFDSPHDLYAKVMYQRVTKKKKPSPTEDVASSSTCLDEVTYKTLQSSRLSSYLEGDALASEVDNRWQLVRKAALAKHSDVIFVDRETSQIKDLMKQFQSDDIQLVLSEHDGLHFVSVHGAKKPTEGVLVATEAEPKSIHLLAGEAAKRRAETSNETLPAAPTAPQSTADVIKAMGDVPVYSIAQARVMLVDFMSRSLKHETIGSIYKDAAELPDSLVDDLEAPRSSDREAMLLIAGCIFPSAPVPAFPSAPVPAPAAEPTALQVATAPAGEATAPEADAAAPKPVAPAPEPAASEPVASSASGRQTA